MCVCFSLPTLHSRSAVPKLNLTPLLLHACLTCYYRFSQSFFLFSLNYNLPSDFVQFSLELDCLIVSLPLFYQLSPLRSSNRSHFLAVFYRFFVSFFTNLNIISNESRRERFSLLQNAIPKKGKFENFLRVLVSPPKL